MKIKIWSLFLALSFLIVAGGIIVMSLKGVQAQVTEVRASKTIVEVISNQIETGNTRLTRRHIAL
jgi:hypothetical protein